MSESGSEVANRVAGAALKSSAAVGATIFGCALLFIAVSTILLLLLLVYGWRLIEIL
jgi:hypothetical protein